MPTQAQADLFLAILALDSYNRGYSPGMTFRGDSDSTRRMGRAKRNPSQRLSSVGGLRLRLTPYLLPRALRQNNPTGKISLSPSRLGKNYWAFLRVEVRFGL
jgi:hypothetical protein